MPYIGTWLTNDITSMIYLFIYLTNHYKTRYVEEWAKKKYVYALLLVVKMPFSSTEQSPPLISSYIFIILQSLLLCGQLWQIEKALHEN